MTDQRIREILEEASRYQSDFSHFENANRCGKKVEEAPRIIGQIAALLQQEILKGKSAKGSPFRRSEIRRVLQLQIEAVRKKGHRLSADGWFCWPKEPDVPKSNVIPFRKR